MLVTEAHAAEKWCPFVRQAEIETVNGIESSVQVVITANSCSDVPRPLFSPCIGARCMAWRVGAHHIDGPDTGYCGLAGVPRKPLAAVRAPRLTSAEREMLEALDNTGRLPSPEYGPVSKSQRAAYTRTHERLRDRGLAEWSDITEAGRAALGRPKL